MVNHAILGPSGAYRWLVCTPSARFEEQLPNEDTVFAKEGTLAHEVAALVLAARSGTYKGSDKMWWADMDAIELLVNDFYEKQDRPSEFADMLDHAEDYAQYVISQTPFDGEVHIGGDSFDMDFNNIAKHILIENRYDVFDYVPLGFGTSDSTIRTKRVIYVTDYKYGAGVRVSAINNAQMKIYGLGALLKAKSEGFNDVQTIVMSIYQPRAGGSSSWQISAEKLLEWADEIVKPQALKAIAGIGEFVPGKHCQFCRARNNCKAFYNEFAELRSLKDSRELTDVDLANVINFGPAVASWVKKVTDDTVARMERGQKVKGFKLVKGRGRRSFTNEDMVVDELIGENFDSYQIFEPKMRSLTDLEKTLGKNKFNELLGRWVKTVEGKPAIVSEDDDRPAIGKLGADEYDEED